MQMPSRNAGISKPAKMNKLLARKDKTVAGSPVSDPAVPTRRSVGHSSNCGGHQEDGRRFFYQPTGPIAQRRAITPSRGKKPPPCEGISA
jgi:hypothetical protein